jgi:hypothetical protein
MKTKIRHQMAHCSDSIMVTALLNPFVKSSAVTKPNMRNSILVIALIMTMTMANGLYFGRSAFAMHDSTLGVNTWFASDNSTQLHTIDLNKGPISPTATTEEKTGEPTDQDPSAADENGDETSNEDGEEEDNGNSEEED